MVRTKINSRYSKAFTIVELLIVIIIIAVLAVLAIVSYNGIVAKANVASLSADLSSNAKTLKLYYSEFGSYPTALDANNCPSAPKVSTVYCLKSTNGNTLAYSGTSTTYLLTSTKGNVTYKVTEATAPTQAYIAPTVPATLSGSVANINQVNLSWSPAAGELTGYKIYRGTSPSPTALLATLTGTGTSYTDSNLSTRTSYYYRIVSYNTYGDSSFSNEINLTTGAANGSSSALASKSCYSLLLNGVTTDGVYWIDPDKNGANAPFQAYCDQTYSGGGWTLLLKATTSTTFNYAASYWTTSNTLNDSDLTLNNSDAKYRSFNEMSVKDLMARWPDINSGTYRWIQNNFYGGSQVVPTTFFSSVNNYNISGGKSTPNWTNGIFSSQGGNNWYGFNFTANGSARMRWGFAWNNELEWASNDVSGGIGVDSAYGNYSAGDRINCCQDTTGINRSARVEIYGRNSSDPAD